MDLLAACALPSNDLKPKDMRHFCGCGSESEPRGVIGVELHGNAGLLRSLAVDEAWRGRGCGKALVGEAEQYAAGNGVRRLYLLTTTAEGFFRTLGYAKVERASVPEAIAKTAEFASLCPASSAIMAKQLGG